VDDADAALLGDGDRQAASVTVSIAADTRGRFSSMLRDSRVASTVSLGRTGENAGTSRTSSKVSAFPRRRIQPPASRLEEAKAPGRGCERRCERGLCAMKAPKDRLYPGPSADSAHMGIPGDRELARLHDNSQCAANGARLLLGATLEQ